MTTQTPRRPEDYLVSMQEARVSSPVSHVLQEGRAGIQEVLRQQYTLPDSLPSSDRDQGYATSSNSEVYAPGMFEVHAGEQEEECDEEPVYTLNVDGLIDALPLQEAKHRNRLSQFSMPDLSQGDQGSAQEETSVHSESKSDPLSPGSDTHSHMGSDRNMSVHYASVSVPHHHPADDPNMLMSPAAVMMMHQSNSNHHLRHHLYNRNQQCEVHCGGYPASNGVPNARGFPVYRQAIPSSVQSYPELPRNVISDKRELLRTSRPPPHPRNASGLPLPDASKMNPITHPPNNGQVRSSNNQSCSDRPSGCPRSQSFEGRPGNSLSQTSTMTQSRSHGHSHQGSSRTHRAPSRPFVPDSTAAERFMYGNFDDDRCSTCSSSSSSEDFDYHYHFSPRSTNKISYVDDMGIGGTVRNSPAQARGRRHRQKNKQCVVQ